MANNRILRFHAPDKVFHSVNAITWFALLFTGVYVYFCEPEAACAEATMLAHLIQPSGLHRARSGPFCPHSPRLP